MVMRWRTFNPANGNDLLRVLATDNPMAGIEDFPVVVVFRASAPGGRCQQLVQ